MTLIELSLLVMFDAGAALAVYRLGWPTGRSLASSRPVKR